jgi:hypothetical protein
MSQYDQREGSSELRLRLKLIVARGLYGVFMAILVQFASLYMSYQFLLINLTGSSLAPFFTWTLIFLLYIPSIVIAKVLKVKKGFDLYFRGITVYFASFVLTHILIAS